VDVRTLEESCNISAMQTNGKNFHVCQTYHFTVPCHSSGVTYYVTCDIQGSHYLHALTAE